MCTFFLYFLFSWCKFAISLFFSSSFLSLKYPNRIRAFRTNQSLLGSLLFLPLCCKLVLLVPLRFLTVFELEDGLLVLSTLVGCLVGLLIFAVVAIADLIACLAYAFITDCSLRLRAERITMKAGFCNFLFCCCISYRKLML